MLNAISLNDLQPSCESSEKLFRDRAGQYSIRINNQWRIRFKWQEGDAHNVEITDYH
jgi:proteic killer suppression protein